MVFLYKSNDDDALYFVRHSDTKVDSCRYLGVIIDKELKWTAHIEQFYSKLIKFTGILYKLWTKSPDQILKQTYFAFVHSCILYGIELYGNTRSTHLDKLSAFNKKKKCASYTAKSTVVYAYQGIVRQL